MAGPLKSVSGKGTASRARHRIAIVVSEWNDEITEALYLGAHHALVNLGVPRTNILRVNVPGSFELPLAAMRLAKRKDIDGVVCLGCVIQGETPHFDYICQAVAQGIMTVNLQTLKPVSFGVLTTLNKKQALERAGGSVGNKGEEAAVTVVRMLA